jgi:hypothetical protein
MCDARRFGMGFSIIPANGFPAVEYRATEYRVGIFLLTHPPCFGLL